MGRILAVSGNRYQQGHLRLLARMLRLLRSRGFELAIHRDFYDYLCMAGVEMPGGAYAADSVPAMAEAVVSVGGDGTFLHTAGWVGTLGIPVVGINTGHLGYLAHFGIDDIDMLADALAAHTMCSEQRMVLCLDVVGEPPRYALNEVAILKDETSSMISVRAVIDESFLADYRADGLILATATGSTGYNMSAGGPLLQPTLDVMILTPIAPHSLTLRPLVVSGDSVVEARTSTRAGRYRVSVDGESFTLPADTTVRVSRASFRVSVLVRGDSDFSSTLRRKLGWATGITGD